MKIIRIFFQIILLVLFSNVAMSQNAELVVKLDTNKIKIGEQVVLRMKVLAPEGDLVEFPILKDTLVKGLEILDMNELEPENVGDSRISYQRNYTITSFDASKYTIPSYSVTIKNKGHNSVVRSKVCELSVVGVKVDKQKAFKDIIAPINTPLNFMEILPYLLIGLLVVLIVILVVYFYKRHKNKTKDGLPIIKKEKAHIIAFRDLNDIKTNKLWTQVNDKEFFTRLTAVLRSYIEDESGVSAMEMTSPEILNAIKDNDLFNDKIKKLLREILENSDLVKFAKFNLLINEKEEALDEAFVIVKEVHQASEEKKKLELEAKLAKEKEIELNDDSIKIEDKKE